MAMASAIRHEPDTLAQERLVEDKMDKDLKKVLEIQTQTISTLRGINADMKLMMEIIDIINNKPREKSLIENCITYKGKDIAFIVNHVAFAAEFEELIKKIAKTIWQEKYKRIQELKEKL